MRVIVGDDRATTRRLVVGSRWRAGIAEWVAAADGGEALERLAASTRPVSTDRTTPGTSGPALARPLRAREGGRTVPILVVTARGGREEVVAALEAGAGMHMVDPFTARTPRARIDAPLAPSPDRSDRPEPRSFP